MPNETATPPHILELHEIAEKAMNANQETDRVRRTTVETSYIDLAIQRVLPELTDDMCDDVLDDMQRGIFLFHEDKRYAVLEVWLSKSGQILEVDRKLRRAKPVKSAYAFTNYGARKFVNALGSAFDALAEKKRLIHADNQEASDKLAALMRA